MRDQGIQCAYTEETQDQTERRTSGIKRYVLSQRTLVIKHTNVQNLICYICI